MFEQQVLAGAKWMDKNSPGWYKRIDLETLNVASEQFCVLGQTLGYRRVMLIAGSEFILRHGFGLHVEITDILDNTLIKQHFAVLTNEWKAEIVRRRKIDEELEKAESKVEKPRRCGRHRKAVPESREVFLQRANDLLCGRRDSRVFVNEPQAPPA